MERRGRADILERNKEQAFVPTKSIVFQNHYGTAPCMMMELNGKLLQFPSSLRGKTIDQRSDYSLFTGKI
jgi:molybdopterin-biosynthesis enzyme MoeA-like protein